METEQDKNNIKHQHKVHLVLMGSYLIFLFAIVLGVFLDTFIKNEIFTDNVYQNVGFYILVFGTLIIFWAQKTSSYTKHTQNSAPDKPYLYFEFGPYKYLRSPTHFGLFAVTVGFSLIINSFFGGILSMVSYLIARIFFFKKEEELLEMKYGQTYLDYKKKVKNWI